MSRLDPSSPVALAALLVANLAPLVGVLAFGWNVFDVLAVYWLESGVVGVLNVPKILLARGTPDESVSFSVNGAPVDFSNRADRSLFGVDVPAVNVFTAGFFCVHYGIFWVVHGVFVLFGLPAFAGAFGSIDVLGVLVAGATMVVSHGGSFVVNYLGHGEYRGVSPDGQMMAPYRRVFVLHLTVVLGAFLVVSLGGPVVLVLLLVVLKTAFDVAAHLREHGRARRRLKTEGPARGGETD
ncbi:DUF6498-containing protein [Halopelagius fulvigenes]|uniref:DUF6498-containing protein n=1 Tax=Halopelagius fulvigenes TaxID=1198324 RepID=A0ABD5U1M6_9EURY